MMSIEESTERCSLQDCQDLFRKFYKVELTPQRDYFSALPFEILYHIFDICPLKDQLVFAKVCKLFREIIRNIYQRKYKYFVYSYLKFKYSLRLQDHEISELCYLSGECVELLRFSTYFSMELLNHIVMNGGNTNPVENLKCFINDNFKQNLKYFKNLRELEVQGKFLRDQIILALSMYCKKLKTIRLLDGDNRWLYGEYLSNLESIENLELKSCRNLDPNHLLVTSQKRNLKSLNIVECEHLKDIAQMLTLCDHWQNIQTLKLTAFSQDSKFLKAIINLPALKTVQFFWINFMPLNFEENLFDEIGNHEEKSLRLRHIKFENDRYYIEDESLQKWTPKNYAIMRENVCINGQAWQWSSETFDKISSAFGNFKNLQTLSFYYCRLLNYDQLRVLCLINPNLEMIKMYGCPKVEDEQFKIQWAYDTQQDRNCSLHKCQLNFESFLTLKEVMNLCEEAHSRRFSSFYSRQPVVRSIECQFH